MRSCDDCTNNAGCAGISLHPILVRVFDLYAGGVTDKFDILFALDEDDEALLEKYNKRIVTLCWSKAALLSIAETVTRDVGDGADDMMWEIRSHLVTAKLSFENFPWSLPEMVEQSGDLYQAILDRDTSGALEGLVSKRNFVKICKDVAYGR